MATQPLPRVMNSQDPKSRWKSLREKWVLPRRWILTFVFLSISIAVGGHFFYRRCVFIAKEQKEATLKSVARLQMNQVVEWRRQWLAEMEFVAESPLRHEVAQYLRRPSDERLRNELATWFSAFQKRVNVKAAALVDATGKTILSSTPPNLLHPPELEFFQDKNPNRTRWLTEIHESPLTGKSEIELVTPLHDPEGGKNRLLAFLVIWFDPYQQLIPLINEWPIPTRTGQSFLVRREGDFVVYLNDSHRRPGTAFKKKIPITEYSNPAAMAVRGMEGIVEGKNLEGDRLLAVIVRIPDSNWFLVAKLDSTEAYAEVHQLAWGVLFGVTVLVLLAAAMVSLLWRQQRVEQLRAAYQKERERAALIEATPDVIVILDKHRNCTWLNTVGMGFFGPSAVGKKLTDFMRSGTEQFLFEVKLQPLFDGVSQGVPLDLWYQRADGEERLLSWNFKPLHNDSGEVVGTLAVGHDITLRRQSEEALRQSEARFRAIFEGAAMGVARLDVHGRIAECNRALQQMLGYSEAEIHNRIFTNVTHPDDVTADWELFRELIEGKRDAYQMEKRYCRKDGSVMWGRLTCSLVRASGSEPPFAIGMVEDITERKKLQQGLAESEFKYRSLVNESLVGVYIFQEDVLRFVNPKLAEIFGYTVEELVDHKSPMDLVYPEDRPLVERHVNRRLRGEVTSVDYSFRGLRKDGTTVEVEVYGLRTIYRGAPAIQGTVLDISERRALQTQLVQAQKMESLGTLAGGIAHDFNNILTGILGFNEMALAKLPAGDPLHSYLTRIHALGQRAAELIKKILLFSRKQKPDIQPIDLSKTIEDFVPFLRRVVEENVEIEVSCDKSLPGIQADPAQLHQVMVNLCVNARDAMPKGGTLKIETSRMRVDADYVSQHSDAHPGDFAVLSISDTGTGMDDMTVKRIFDPFFTTKEAGKGTGLGLAVCFGIVKEHGGWMEVNSEAGRGSTFKTFLPFPESPPRVSAPSTAETTLPTGSGECVLVVDDEPQLCDLAQNILKQLNYEVLTAHSGQEALHLYRQQGQRVSLVMTDMVMPRGSGSDLARQIRAENPRVPILLCSGYSVTNPPFSDPIMERMEFLSKPYTTLQLARKIHALLHPLI